MKQLTLILLLFTLNACASIVEGDTQSLSLATPNCPNAQCKLTNEQGTFYINGTPGTVTVNKSTSPMSIICTKGEKSEMISVESGTESMSFGNILFGGIIGAGVDMSTGAAYVYPDHIEHPLSCKTEKLTRLYN